MKPRRVLPDYVVFSFMAQLALEAGQMHAANGYLLKLIDEIKHGGCGQAWS